MYPCGNFAGKWDSEFTPENLMEHFAKGICSGIMITEIGRPRIPQEAAGRHAQDAQGGREICKEGMVLRHMPQVLHA